jgi:hypothetical protein
LLQFFLLELLVIIGLLIEVLIELRALMSAQEAVIEGR